MANVVLVLDPDSERRRRFLEAVSPIMPVVDGLHTSRISVGHLGVAWAANPRAPVSQHADEDHLALIWGHAIGESGAQEVSAETLSQLWDPLLRDTAATLPAPLEGYHAALLYRESGALLLGADLLGLFPVYYYERDGVLLAGSSPEPFRYHPVFRMELDPAGLVGILLTMHLVENQTLLKGVRRLAPGCLLVVPKSGSVREVPQYAPTPSSLFFDLPFAGQVEILGQAIRDAVAKQTPANKPCALLLSGGLDSRMLAGFLHNQGTRVVAFTLGTRGDDELTCALPVARTLRLEHSWGEIDFSHYPACADLQARWQQGADGFNTIEYWHLHNVLRNLPAYVVTGAVSDSIVGGSHIDWGYSPTTRTMSFDTFFGRINTWGIPLDDLQKLLREDVLGGLPQHLVAQLRHRYESYGEMETHRAWCFDLHHRQRFHVGSTAWRASFGAWPIVPVMTRRLLEVAGGMPASTLAVRRAQAEVVLRYLPSLADLPIAGMPPLRRRVRTMLKLSVEDWLTRLRARSNRERRQRWNRVYDVNNPGWLAVRRAAEPFRRAGYEFFKKSELDAFLHPPDVPIRRRDPKVDVSGVKSVLEFFLWCRDHL